jgi:predicted nuclease of predicted toxin-antitoxin system
MEDKRVMSTAINEDRTILTFDRDYGELIFKHHYKPPKGVIYLRIDKYSAEEPGLLIEEWLSKSEINFEYALTVLDGTSIRQRRYV